MTSEKTEPATDEQRMTWVSDANLGFVRPSKGPDYVRDKTIVQKVLAMGARIEAEKARADEMGRMVTLTERNLVARSNRIAELEETLRDLHDNPPDLAARQSARIAALEEECSKAFDAGQAARQGQNDERITELERELQLLRIGDTSAVDRMIQWRVEHKDELARGEGEVSDD